MLDSSRHSTRLNLQVSLMDSKSKIPFQPGRLQQQPLRPANRQQQQSSGWSEFQPRKTPRPGSEHAYASANAPS